MVTKIFNTEDSLYPLGNISQDIKALMAGFQDCNITFCYRQYNSVAHSLAKFVWNVNNVAIWFGKLPLFCPKPIDLTKMFVILILNES